MYYHRNQQYSVVALSTASGQLVEEYVYEPYGKFQIIDPNATPPYNPFVPYDPDAPVFLSTSAYGNRMTYTGREYDKESDLFYFRARMYDADLGRFVSRDAVGYITDLTLYGLYASLHMTDPSGHNPKIECNDNEKLVEKSGMSCCSGRNCTWTGFWTIKTGVMFLMSKVSSYSHFTGTDDTGCHYIQEGTGSGISVLAGVGYFEMQFSIIKAKKSCKWPMTKYESKINASAAGIGADVSFGSPIDIPDIEYTQSKAGPFSASGWNTTGGFNAFVLGVVFYSLVYTEKKSMTAPDLKCCKCAKD